MTFVSNAHFRETIKEEDETEGHIANIPKIVTVTPATPLHQSKPPSPEKLPPSRPQSGEKKKSSDNGRNSPAANGRNTPNKDRKSSTNKSSPAKKIGSSVKEAEVSPAANGSPKVRQSSQLLARKLTACPSKLWKHFY